MKSKFIKSVFTKKFNSWVDSILDNNVKSLVKNNSIITGGAITSLLLNEHPNDYDIYFTNKETVLAVTNYYVNYFKSKHENINIEIKECDEGRIKIFIKSDGIIDKTESDETESNENVNFSDFVKKEFVESIEKIDDIKIEDNIDNKYKPKFITSNAITLSNKIQLIIRFYGNAEDIHKNYDYVHATNYWQSWDNKLILHAAALESTLTKELIYVGSLYPIASIVRMRKFIKRGWNINAGQILKICYQISELNLNDINVLEDQLIGVDVSYFSMLIDILKEQKEKNNDFEYEKTYINSIIDKIF